MPSLRDLPALADVVAKLEDIQNGSGAYHIDPLAHAENCIRDMQAAARAALAALERVEWEEKHRVGHHLYDKAALDVLHHGNPAVVGEPVAVLPLTTEDEDAECICVPCPKCDGSGKALRRKDAFCPRCDGGSEDDKDRCVCETEDEDAS